MASAPRPGPRLSQADVSEQHGPRRRMVFVGSGHAHLHALKHCDRYVARGHEVVVVSPGAFWYSGLATGVLGGHYPPGLDRIDVESIVRNRGGRFIADRVIGVDSDNGSLALASGRSLDYDVVSLNVGSTTRPIEGESDFAARSYAPKPVRRLFELREELEAGAPTGAGRPHVVVAGGGPTAFELAANLLGLGERLGAPFPVTLIAGSGPPIEQLPRGAAGALIRSLRRRGLELIEGEKAVRVVEDGVVTDRGRTIPCDRFINATGLKPPPLARDAGLSVDGEDSMIVDRHLRSIDDASIFGGGDCIRPADGAIDKVGVYAIRQAPVLLENTLAALDGAAPPRRFSPQKRYLWIMNLGDGTGLAARGRLWFRGRLAFRLKDWIDRRFLRSVRD